MKRENMQHKEMNTLSEAINSLTREGFEDGFELVENGVFCRSTGSTYQPTELQILKTLRFEGESNPMDNALVLAMIAADGTKGTLILSYGAQHNQNDDIIREIPYAE